MYLQGREQRLVTQGRHLGHLAHRRSDLPHRQALQGVGVEHDRGGLVKGAHQVLALRQIHAGLAPDRRIDLGEERRGHLDPGHPTQVGSGQEPRRVAQRATADRDQRIPPLHVQPGQLPCGIADHRERLGRLATRQRDDVHLPACRSERVAHPGAERCPRPGLGHDHGSSSVQGAQGVDHGDGSDAGAEGDLADRGGGAQQRRAGRRSAGDQGIDRVHHLGERDDAVDPHRRAVEALSGADQLADPAKRVTALDQRPDVG